MAQSYKPAGYTSVAPYLMVPDAAAAMDFLDAVFGAQRLRVIPRPQGGLMHAEVRIGDTVVMLGDAMEGWPACPSHVHVYVPDVDQVWSRAMTAGAKPVQVPVRKDDEDKRGGFQDASGTTWWIATMMA